MCASSLPLFRLSTAGEENRFDCNIIRLAHPQVCSVLSHHIVQGVLETLNQFARDFNNNLIQWSSFSQAFHVKEEAG